MNRMERVKREIAEVNEILKQLGFNRRERRIFVKTIKKQARLEV